MAQPSSSCERIAQDLVRALRGRRSQNGLSRRLGARSNVVHRWETGACYPSASRFLHVCVVLGVDVAGSYARMFQRAPGWLGSVDPTSPAAVAAFLDDLRGKTPIIDLASAASVNRFTVSRWLKGSAQPNLPQFLGLIDAASRRLIDFVSTLIDPRKLPSLAADSRRLERVRRLAYEEPWSHAVLRVLQLRAHEGGADVRWIAQRLALSASAVRRLLGVLQRAGEVRKWGDRWVAEQVLRVDTGVDRARARSLKAFWARVALERLDADAPGVFGYSLFEVSHADLNRLRALQLDYGRAMQSIIASSADTECVGLYSAALLDLAVPTHNALAQRVVPAPDKA